ncbi:MAG: glycosyltransferase [Cyanobacteriota bacterium]|nr:glycosyltransferase [Cyanobacteriota bacterium]
MLSIVIPTFGREQVLVDTIAALEPQRQALGCASELLVVDQTPMHEPATTQALSQWQQQGRLRWLRLSRPHLTRAMNTGLVQARGETVLFLDDDIEPRPGLLAGHLEAHRRYPQAWAVVGQVLQPGQRPQPMQHRGGRTPLWRDLDFPFNSTAGAWIENAMAGNLSLCRSRALAIGGFDERFPPPVAARFETEFAKRLIAAGGRIRFAPQASLRHLAAASGGTRSRGGHLTSASGHHGVGDCYYALRCGRRLEPLWYLLWRPLREVRTRFHLRHPWWIPVKLVGEARALAQALSLWRLPPLLLAPVRRP